MSHVAVIGEAVADTFPKAARTSRGTLELETRPGGGPVNTAVALGRLGTPTAFVGRLATGPFGELIRDHLTESGVDLSGSVTAAEPATLAITALDPYGRATYEFYANGTADWQWTRDELTRNWPGGVRCVHTGSLALAREPGGPLIEELLERRRPQATISIDPNVRPQLVPAEVYRERLDRWTSLADIFRLSDEDFEHLAPDVELEQACDRWHDDGVRLVIVTLGSEGAFASLSGARVTVPAPQVTVEDTVGAGDAFTAGLLHWLDVNGHLGARLDALTPAGLTKAMTFAAQVAAETCTVPGADPPWRSSVTPSPV